MTASIRRRENGVGFTAGPYIASYRYAVSLNSIAPFDRQPYACREFIFSNGEFHSYRVGRAGNFYEIGFGKPGDPLPTVEVTNIECPNG